MRTFREVRQREADLFICWFAPQMAMVRAEPIQSQEFPPGLPMGTSPEYMSRLSLLPQVISRELMDASA